MKYREFVIEPVAKGVRYRCASEDKLSRVPFGFTHLSSDKAEQNVAPEVVQMCYW